MKFYYTQEKIASSLRIFFSNFSISKPHLKSLSYIIIGMISAESVVTSDISRKLKDDFSSILLESVERRFRRFFKSFSEFAYSFFESFISYVISHFCGTHFAIVIFIFLLTICFVRINLPFFFSLFVLVSSGIPIWFRCFKGKHNHDSYSLDLIKQGISFTCNLFANKNYHIIYLADRWFPHVEILSHIQSLRLFLLCSC